MVTPDAEDDGGPLDPRWTPYGTVGLLPRVVIDFHAAATHAGIAFLIHDGEILHTPLMTREARVFACLVEPLLRRLLEGDAPGIH